MKRPGTMYSSRSCSTNITARDGLCVAVSFCSAPIRLRDQFPIGRALLSSCCCNRAHQTWKSHASVSTVHWLVARGSASIAGLISSALRSFTAMFRPEWARRRTWAGFSVVCCSMVMTFSKSSEKSAKYVTTTKKYLSSIWVVSSLSWVTTALDVWDSSSYPGHITYAR